MDVIVNIDLKKVSYIEKIQMEKIDIKLKISMKNKGRMAIYKKKVDLIYKIILKYNI